MIILAKEYIEPNSYAEENYPRFVCPIYAGARRIARDTGRSYLLSEMPDCCPNARTCSKEPSDCRIIDGSTKVVEEESNVIYVAENNGRVDAFMRRLEQHEALVSGR